MNTRMKPLSAAIALALATLGSPPALAFDYYWVGPNQGWWDSAGVTPNWRSTVAYAGDGFGTAGWFQPHDGDNVYLFNNGASAYNTNYWNTSYPNAVLGDLRIDSTGGGLMALRMDQTNQWLRTTNSTIGFNGTGLLRQTKGTHAVSKFLILGEDAGSNGSYELLGTGALSADAVVVGSKGHGSLSVSQGTLVNSAGGGFIAYFAGSSGVATVTGGNSRWTIGSAPLFVGNGGNATLNIESGGYVSSSYGIISNGGVSNSTVTVTGHDITLNQGYLASRWNNAGGLTIGNISGQGTLNISAGGVVNNTVGLIGNYAGSVGSVTVSGIHGFSRLGSSWANAADLHVANEGAGTLYVLAGASVTSATGHVGTGGSGVGSVTVSGSNLFTQVGSSWAVTAGLDVGESGDGTLLVGAGGVVSNTLGRIGTNAGSVGRVSVSGVWTNSNVLWVGLGGKGTLDITGGSVSDTFGLVGVDNGSTGTVTLTGGGSWANAVDLSVGVFGTGTLNILSDNNNVSNESGWIGRSAGGQGTVTVEGLWTNRADLTVGESGRGTLTIQGNGKVTNQAAWVGRYAGSHGLATVTGNGALWDAQGWTMGVGNAGTGSLRIDNAGAVQNAAGQVGALAGGDGTVTVTGGGSKWTNTSTLDVGGSGKGTLNIQSAGAVSNTRGYVGRFAGSDGTVTVTGTDSTWANSAELFLGFQGTGTLHIEDGGLVSNAIGFIGASSGGKGVVTVTGANSRWQNSSTLYTGFSGEGKLNIEAGGVVSNGQGYIGHDPKRTGSVTVTGPGSQWNNTSLLAVAEKGLADLKITDGGLVTNTRGYVGRFAGSDGTVTVSGTDSTWTNSSDLYIGDQGTGTMNILAGAGVSNQAGLIGAKVGGNGAVTVSGASSWKNSGDLAIGQYGNGVLVVEGGSTVESFSGSIYGGSSATVRGEGSTWTNYNPTPGQMGPPPTLLSIQGGGTLGIESGGAVSANLGYVGDGGTGTATVTVTGAGSKWTGDALYVGRTSNGTVNVQDGGQVESAQARLGFNAGFTGTVTVDGQGSTWTNTADQYIGWGGTAFLNVLEGGLVRNTSFIATVGELAGSFGQVSLFNVGSTWDNATAALTIGGSGTGMLEINGGALVNSASGIVGDGLNSQGTVKVGVSDPATQAPSTWTNSGALTVGLKGTGTLYINYDGVVSNTAGYVGREAAASGSGTVFVTDGARWTNTSALIVGDAGKGSLTIDSGGLVESDEAVIGKVAGSDGKVTLAGAGTRWINTRDLTVGDQGHGLLEIRSGATVDSAEVKVGAGSQLTMAGGTLQGGSLVNNGLVVLGVNGVVRSDLTARSASRVTVSPEDAFTPLVEQATVLGTADFQSGSEMNVPDQAIVFFRGQVFQRAGALFTGTGYKVYEGGFAVGNSPGLGTDAGDISFGAGNVYEAEIGGTDAGDAQGNGIEFDRYVVAGKLSFDGTLKVLQFDGFAPQAGQSFDLFDWGSAEGQFSAIDFSAAPLTNGLVWNTSKLYIDGTLAVTAVPEPHAYAMLLAGLGLMGFATRRRLMAA